MAHRRQLLEGFGVGRILLGLAGLALARQQQLLEQHEAELLRRVDVELAAGQPVDLLLELLHLHLEHARHLLQVAEVEQHAAVLEGGEQRHQRLLDLPGKVREVGLGQLAAHGLQQLPGQGDLLGGVAQQNVVAGERIALRAEAGVARAHRGGVQPVEHDRGEIVRAGLRTQQVGRDHGVEKAAGKLRPRAEQAHGPP